MMRQATLQTLPSFQTHHHHQEQQQRVPSLTKVQPTLLSKLNTCLQLGLIGSIVGAQAPMLSGLVGWEDVVYGLEVAAVGTTFGSFLQYRAIFARQRSGQDPLSPQRA